MSAMTLSGSTIMASTANRAQRLMLVNHWQVHRTPKGQVCRGVLPSRCMKCGGLGVSAVCSRILHSPAYLTPDMPPRRARTHSVLTVVTRCTSHAGCRSHLYTASWHPLRKTHSLLQAHSLAQAALSRCKPPARCKLQAERYTLPAARALPARVLPVPACCLLPLSHRSLHAAWFLAAIHSATVTAPRPFPAKHWPPSANARCMVHALARVAQHLTVAPPAHHLPPVARLGRHSPSAPFALHRAGHSIKRSSATAVFV
ncbi:hypothetical protein GGX14DRAFT_394872 [Mycena pura]|uniref:Uncharacterized protein n=1 Tax=Mycena pura TaxID=153505 RepID=A0AAD6VHT3_9AGAR|nr:hypothetical protein GGX14DRAFT_394872 [Mycena pura]